MKTRTGFVSNSSTTSFTIYGISLDLYGIDRDKNREIRDKIEAGLCDFNKSNPEGRFRRITTAHGEEGYVFYFGYDWDDLPDDMTPAQFKAEAKADIEALLKELNIDLPIGLGKYSESWYDG